MISKDGKNLKVLGLINARGGSKGIPRKNVKALNGKPLLAYSIESALRSKYLDLLVVSTEDQEIARVAQENGAAVPFLRPMQLSDDGVRQVDVVEFTIKHLKEKSNESFDILVLLQPTSPFRTAADIDGAVGKMVEKDSGSVMSVALVEHNHPLNMYKIEGKFLSRFMSDEIKQRQNFPPLYVSNGAVYAVRTPVFLQTKSFQTSDCLPYIMPAERSVNIDTPFDWKLAEWLLQGGSYGH